MHNILLVKMVAKVTGMSAEDINRLKSDSE